MVGLSIDSIPRSCIGLRHTHGQNTVVPPIPFELTFDSQRVSLLRLEGWKEDELSDEIVGKVRENSNDPLKLVGCPVGGLPLCIEDIQFDSEDEWTVWLGVDDDLYDSEVCNKDPFIALNTVLETMVVSSPTKGTKQIIGKLLYECGLEKYSSLGRYLNETINKMECFEGVHLCYFNRKSCFDFDALKMGQLIVGGKTIGSAGENREALLGKKVTIVGRLRYCKNRNELAKIIEYYGGAVTSSLTPNASYLITDHANNISDAVSKTVQCSRNIGGSLSVIDEEYLFKLLGFEPKDLCEIKKKIGI